MLAPDYPLLNTSAASHVRKTHSDDATVFRGQEKGLFADVCLIVRRCFSEEKSIFGVRRCSPKNADLYPPGYNDAGIRISFDFGCRNAIAPVPETLFSSVFSRMCGTESAGYRRVCRSKMSAFTGMGIAPTATVLDFGGCECDSWDLGLALVRGFSQHNRTWATKGNYIMILTAFGAFLGAFFSLIASIYIEYQRRPKLSFVIEETPCEIKDRGGVKDARFLRVKLLNAPIDRMFKWLGREAAIQCRGQIEFCHLDDKKPIFSRPMPIRWSSSEEPITTQLGENNVPVKMFDSTKYNEAFLRNCYPGTPELIDIAARFDAESDCYGWSNETYLPSKGWRNPEWKLEKGRYIVRVTVNSVGQIAVGEFKLENSAGRADFRLTAV